MGLLNVKTGLVTFANAGHNPPLVKRADGRFEYHRTKAGLVLAGMEGIRYRRFNLQLQPGDTLYLYTDGVTEAINVDQELFGEDRLLEALNRDAGADPQRICDGAKAEVDVFAGEAEQFDDLTMMCLAYEGTTEVRKED
jgi:sigma-B regulation protein RsbU (phosphoserine phosphatase)